MHATDGKTISPEVSRSSSKMPIMSRSPDQDAGSSAAAVTLIVLSGKRATCEQWVAHARVGGLACHDKSEVH
jgi:hypothetical protein